MELVTERVVVGVVAVVAGGVVVVTAVFVTEVTGMLVWTVVLTVVSPLPAVVVPEPDAVCVEVVVTETLNVVSDWACAPRAKRVMARALEMAENFMMCV